MPPVRGADAQCPLSSGQPFLQPRKPRCRVPAVSARNARTARGITAKRGAQICRARGIKNAGKRIQFAEVDGIGDPTDHAAVIKAVERWLAHDDPFDFGRRQCRQGDRRGSWSISVPVPRPCTRPGSCSAGTAALGGADSVVEFVQGDGGLAERPVTDGPPPNPLRYRADRRAFAAHRPQGRGAAAHAGTGRGERPPGGVDRPALRRPPPAHRPCRHARPADPALQGERGTGKTFLAHYYHRRRQVLSRVPARQGSGEAEVEGKSKGGPATAKARRRRARRANASRRRRASATSSASRSPSTPTWTTLRDTLFGWVKGRVHRRRSATSTACWARRTAAPCSSTRSITWPGPLQAALLGPLNNRRYRPKMSPCEVVSHFDLVVATNDPQWRDKMADDFRDRIERIVLEVPAFRSFQRHGADDDLAFLGLHAAAPLPRVRHRVHRGRPGLERCAGGVAWTCFATARCRELARPAAPGGQPVAAPDRRPATAAPRRSAGTARSWNAPSRRHSRWRDDAACPSLKRERRSLFLSLSASGSL